MSRREKQGYAGSSVSNGSSTSHTTGMQSLDAVVTPDGRRRQNKRDEAIRKKLEAEINKRKNQVGTQKQQPRKRPAGSVLALKPSPPLTMRLRTTIHEAAQFMSAKRENCVLVLDDDDSVCGIFTAKDIAFKIVGAGKDAKAHTIEDIMTANPLCARTETSATDALNLMVERGFRHLPVMDENQDIAGVLDITKCFYEAMNKLDRVYQSSRKLHDALEGVQSELGSSQPAQIIQYVEALKAQTAGPDLESVLDGKPPIFVDVRTNVSEIAKLMKENRTTAVLVTDQDAVTGIFTTKDIVLRVIAAGYNPKNCSVVRVMTPQPDFAPKTMSIQAALRKMHDGHYLNLPVMGDDNEIIGIVDVLKLTYATLEQINNMNSGDGSEGPAWSRFWQSLDVHDNESATSAEGRPHTPLSSMSDRQSVDLLSSPPPDVSASELAQFNIGNDVAPGDSVSRMGSRMQAYPDLESAFAFKLKSPTGRVHRINVSPSDGLEFLRKSIVDKFLPNEIEALGGAGLVEDGRIATPGFAVSYVDDEGDAVAITSDHDLTDAIRINRSQGLDKADLYVHHPDTQIDPPPRSAPSRRSLGAPSAADEEASKTDSKREKSTGQPEVIPGVPNDLLLPGAIVTLAVSIVLVFTFSRSSR